MAMKVVKAGPTFQASFKVGNSLFGNNILRQLEHTLGAYQKKALNYVGVLIKEILKQICILRHLGYVPGFCWNFLRNIYHQKSFLSQWFSFSWWDMWSFWRFSPLWTGKSHSKHPFELCSKSCFRGEVSERWSHFQVVSLREGDFAMPLGQIFAELVVGFLRGGCSRGGGNWGILKILREDWGTLGNII